MQRRRRFSFVEWALPFAAVAGSLGAAEQPAPVAEKPTAVAAKPVATVGATAVKPACPPLPQALASFGAAVTGGHLYLYGGHTGRAHVHAKNTQTGAFLRVSLSEPTAWETLPAGPAAQGLGLVGHEGKVYRIGGMQARNEDPAKEDLHSLAEVACFDPAVGSWKALPPLPAGRSSHDAVVLGNKLCVVGGWNLKGDSDDAEWHSTALSLDLSKADAVWEQLPAPPFKRRALAVATVGPNKLIVLGGMTDDGEISRACDVLDLTTGRWSDGPALPGEGHEGFGVAAFEVDGRVYASAMSGKVQRLAADGSAWEEIAELSAHRFFHRILPWTKKELVFLGGAAPKKPHLVECEILSLK